MMEESAVFEDGTDRTSSVEVAREKRGVRNTEHQASIVDHLEQRNSIQILDSEIP